MIEITILAVALVVGLAISFYFKSIDNSWILVPVNIEKPVPDQTDLARFKFAKLLQIKDRTKYRPKLLMALILFVLTAFLGQILLHQNDMWKNFVEYLFIVLVIALFLSSTNIFIAMILIFGLCYLLGNWFSWSYFYLGVAMGLIPCISAGMVLFRNYIGMLRSTHLEIKNNHTKEGVELSWWKRNYCKIYQVFLFFVPIMIGYEVFNAWSGPIVLTQETTNYAVVTFTLVTSLNVVFFTVPMFKEMLEKSSIHEAAEFSEYVEAHYRNECPERAPLEKITVTPIAAKANPKKRIDEHLDSNGKWLLFQQQQIFSIYTITLFLLANTILQMILKSVQMGFVTNFDIFNRVSLFDMITLLTGFCSLANFIFFFGLLGYWANRLNWKANEKDVEETNTDITWKAYQNPQQQMYCYSKKSMPALEIAP